MCDSPQSLSSNRPAALLGRPPPTAGPSQGIQSPRQQRGALKAAVGDSWGYHITLSLHLRVLNYRRLPAGHTPVSTLFPQSQPRSLSSWGICQGLPLPCWSLPLNPERARPGNSLVRKVVTVTVWECGRLEGFREGGTVEIPFAHGTLLELFTVNKRLYRIVQTVGLSTQTLEEAVSLASPGRCVPRLEAH